MANKRSLKRCINYICGELFAECISVSAYYNSDKQNADTLLRCIMRVHSDYIMRVSHPEPGMPAKAYYKKLKEDFIAQASDIIDQINNI